MSIPISFKFGTQAQYNAATIVDGALYFIEDTHRLYRGAKLIADYNENVVFASAVPETTAATPGVLYVVNVDGKVGIWYQPTENAALIQISGGEAEEGSITDLAAFDEALVDTVATGLSDDDDHIATSGAVKAAITEAIDNLDDPIVGVEAARSEAGTATVLKFTSAAGVETEVNVADFFLTGAQYDADSHKLKLTVQGVEDPVEVDLSDLVPQAVTTAQVALSEGFTSTVAVGNIAKGEEIDISTIESMQDLIMKIFVKDSNPTTVQPTASVTLTGAGVKEVGSTFNPAWSVGLNAGSYSANKNGAQATGVTATKYAVTDTDGHTADTQSGTFDAFTVTDSTNYKVSATVTHSAGNIPTTYLGVEYPAGQIAEGTKSASSAAVTGYRPGFYGSLTSKTGTVDSDLVRDLANKTTAAVTKGKTYTLVVPVGAIRVVIAYPASIGDIASVTSSIEFGSEIKDSFDKNVVSVNDASGANAINYNVYVKDMAEALDAATTLTIKI